MQSAGVQLVCEILVAGLSLAPRLELEAIFGLGAVIINWVLCQQSYLFLLQELDLLARGL